MYQKKYNTSAGVIVFLLIFVCFFNAGSIRLKKTCINVSIDSSQFVFYRDRLIGKIYSSSEVGSREKISINKFFYRDNEEKFFESVYNLDCMEIEMVEEAINTFLFFNDSLNLRKRYFYCFSRADYFRNYLGIKFKSGEKKIFIHFVQQTGQAPINENSIMWADDGGVRYFKLLYNLNTGEIEYFQPNGKG